jgi:hypothetical protein
LFSLRAQGCRARGDKFGASGDCRSSRNGYGSRYTAACRCRCTTSCSVHARADQVHAHDAANKGVGSQPMLSTGSKCSVWVECCFCQPIHPTTGICLLIICSLHAVRWHRQTCRLGCQSTCRMAQDLRNQVTAACFSALYCRPCTQHRIMLVFDKDSQNGQCR